MRLVPGLKNMPVPVLLTRKIRYTNKAAPVQRPFLLAGELASPAGRVLRVSSTGTGMFFRPGTNLISVAELILYSQKTRNCGHFLPNGGTKM